MTPSGSLPHPADSHSATHDGNPIRPRRALISVSDKTGLVALGHALVEGGVELVATGSTAAELRAAGIPVLEVSDLTGFPEILGGRVKTLHPKIHAGILAKADEESRATLKKHSIDPFDVVVANLYPFAQAVSQGASLPDCIEQIDIGGPTLIRAAAKNFARVAVIVDPSDYVDLIASVTAGSTSQQQRLTWATKAFQTVASYDITIANWFTETMEALPNSDALRFTPSWVGMSFTQSRPLRYGENPHQVASLYVANEGGQGGVSQAELLGGKPLSYNNLQDSQAAWDAVENFADQAAVAIIKHANPCGLATSNNVEDAYRKALACDPLSAFGGVVAVNRPVGADLASLVTKVFTEVVLAPEFSEEALEILRTKPSLRILQMTPPPASAQMKVISGGLLIQSPDTPGDEDEFANWELVAGKPVSDDNAADLQFAWRACQYAKSNAIVLIHNEATVGVGMGQVNRVDAAKLAVERANTLDEGRNRTMGAVAASDAFFPFPDGLEVLTDAGVVAIVAPGGSRNDNLVIEAAKAADVSLYFTKRRHFAH